jgi:phosphatidylglycerophosphate synthase
MKNLFGPKPYEAILTIPNLITFIGIFLLIPYVACFLAGGNRWVMFGTLFLAGCSDLFDGLLARRLKQKTHTGEIIDSLRDRLLCGAVLGNILYLGGTHLIKWITAIVIIELSIAVINFHRREKPNVHLIGKLRQAGHLLICGLIIISCYFGDVVANFAGFKFVFPLELALPMMALFSLGAFVAYGWRRLFEN